VDRKRGEAASVSPRPKVILAALSAAALAFALAQTMLIPCLPVIRREFHTTPSGAGALITAFFISGAISGGVFGRFGDMFGKRRMIIVQMVLFSIGALICAVGPSLFILLVGRVLMGCAVGLFPLAFSIVRDEFPREHVARAVALLGGITGTGAATGQATGGLVADSFGYRWVFWIAVITGVASIAGLLFVPESPVRTRGRIDFVGAGLLGGGLALPLVGISQVPKWGWVGEPTLLLFAAGVITLSAFVVYESRYPDPLIDIPTLRRGEVGLTNLATILVGIGLFSGSTILSQFFQEPPSTGYGFGAGPTQAGLFLVPGSALLLLSAPVAGRLSTNVGPRTTLFVGAICGAFALEAMALWHQHAVELYLWPTLMYLGIGFAFGAMPTLILEAVPPEKSGQSTAVNTTIRNVGTSVGIQVAATLITSSVGRSGQPSERGYVHAFELLATVGLVSAIVAFAIPRRRRVRRTDNEAMVAIELPPP
jgi:MFS family permease